MIVADNGYRSLEGYGRSTGPQAVKRRVAGRVIEPYLYPSLLISIDAKTDKCADIIGIQKCRST
jgi:hypothetical protein